MQKLIRQLNQKAFQNFGNPFLTKATHSLLNCSNCNKRPIWESTLCNSSMICFEEDTVQSMMSKWDKIAKIEKLANWDSEMHTQQNWVYRF